MIILLNVKLFIYLISKHLYLYLFGNKKYLVFYIMNYKIKSCNKKPTNNIVDNQLFSFDVSFNGAKNFFFDTYNNIYDIIINNKSESNFYEDNTFSNKIKLFVDIDEHHIFDSQLERDKYANNFVSSIIMSINIKLYQTFKINNPKIIILMSDTLLKLSLHLIYP